ncbi:hypothetical protein BBP00_00004423 [Phytophthora kernoviae]|uniref:Uncharacterized protein n=1 Tax=Phytophthora kernoviae TaxID=325452 RepID=A0A3F2RRU7_9STRA|nr:hypothetical protein BBP00_00004423 [Phytophthora kernoviae]
MPKAEKGKPKRACPLEKQLAFDNKPWYDQNGKKNARRGQDSDDDMAEDVVPEKLSRRTLALARQQQAEEQARHNKTKEKQETPQDQAASSDESDEEEEDDDMDTDGYDDQDLVRINGEYVEEVEICEDDEEALANFMGGAAERRNLADIIMDKIFEKEARERGEMDDDSQAPMQHSKFDPKIVEVYTGVGKILQRYTSGKLPKAFKIVPSLSYWEDILWLTNPEKWSPHAMRAATRLFASNLNPKMAQRFFNIFLLEHVRQDIHENKRLNFHLYMALKKALYKPQAFFKGVIIPLCESRNCTQREAAIIGSVLSKVSVPVIHSAATLMKLASMEYSGGNSMFIRVLLNKKYSLPTRVISELSQHFLRFTSDTRKLPVLWHQSLLVFAQRYKNDIPKQYKEAMKALMKQHFHHQITPEIRRELFNEIGVWFYQVPTGQVTSLAPRADAWDPENPFLTGSIRVLQRGDACFVQLFEPVNISTDSDTAVSPTLFAQCPLRITRDEALDIYVHDCVDSSRYFMLRVEDEESGRRAFVGIGFPDRTAAFNFKATLQDYTKYALRQLEVHTVETVEETKDVQTSPKKDMSLPEGTTIRIHFKGNEDGDKAVRHRRSSSGGGTVSPAKVPMIPPPPGDSPSAAVKAPAIAPPPSTAEPTSAVDDEDWGDFTSA